MSDYHYRMKMDGNTCHKCDEGTIHGDATSAKCDNPECNFNF